MGCGLQSVHHKSVRSLERSQRESEGDGETDDGRKERWSKKTDEQCACAFVRYVSLSLSLSHTHTIKHTHSIPTPSNDAALSVTSAEDAMKMLALQHKQQQQQQKKPATSTKDNERAAYDFSKEQLARVRANLRKFGEPNPAQCGT